MTDDSLDLQELAAAERDVQALATGELELTPVEDPDEAAAIIAQLPFPDAPHNMIRPVRIPLEIDAQIRDLAASRGATISAMIRDLIVAGLEAMSEAAPDPVAQLNRHLDAAQRAVRELAADRHRDAA